MSPEFRYDLSNHFNSTFKPRWIFSASPISGFVMQIIKIFKQKYGFSLDGFKIFSHFVFVKSLLNEKWVEAVFLVSCIALCIYIYVKLC